MGFRRPLQSLGLGLAGRRCCSALAFAVRSRRCGMAGLGAARLLAGGLCLWALYELWRYIQRTNCELARFLEAVRLGDLSQSFAHRAATAAASPRSARRSTRASAALRDERHRLTDASRFFEAVLDDAPTPLLTVDGEGRVELDQQGRAAAVRPPQGRPDRGFPRSMARPSRRTLGRRRGRQRRGWCR